MSACVKVFGRRPIRMVRRAPVAGVRKPPKEETAMGERQGLQPALWGLSVRVIARPGDFEWQSGLEWVHNLNVTARILLNGD
jgi:hypothetical protein